MCPVNTPYRDGTTHVIFEPEDFIARIVALVPKPRAHLTRDHGVFAPGSPDRARIVPRTGAAASAARGEVSVSDRQRAGSGLRRDALAFPGERGRFTRLNHEGSSRLRRTAASIYPQRPGFSWLRRFRC
jgi:hypothetical protein